MKEQWLYSFMYDEIKHCYSCPFNYDYLYCQLDHYTNNKQTIKLTDLDDNKRPDNCPLDETNKLNICGYEIKQLKFAAELLLTEGVTPEELQSFVCGYLHGYRALQDEMNYNAMAIIENMINGSKGCDDNVF